MPAGIVFLASQQEAVSLSENKQNLLSEIANCTVVNGVRYSADDSPYHVMDVYMPTGQGPFPAIIYIHGGGWVKGSRADYNTTASFYAKRGIAGFSIDYALTTQNHTAWPDNAQDVVEAIRFIIQNAENYSVDATRLAVLGYSAGAQFASLAGTLSGNESFLLGSSGNETIRSHVSLVMDYSGATDFDYIGKYANETLIYHILTNALGNVTYSENPNLWHQASAATYISSDDPIFFIVHGTADFIVPISVAESFNTKLQAAGVETHFVRLVGGDHEILTNPEENQIVRYSLEPLLKRVFHLDQPSTAGFTTPLLFSPLLMLIAAIIHSKISMKFGAPAGIWTRVRDSRGRYT